MPQFTLLTKVLGTEIGLACGGCISKSYGLTASFGALNGAYRSTVSAAISTIIASSQRLPIGAKTGSFKAFPFASKLLDTSFYLIVRAADALKKVKGLFSTGQPPVDRLAI